MTIYIKPPSEFVAEQGLPPYPGWYPASICGVTDALRYWNGEAFQLLADAGYDASKILPYSDSSTVQWMRPWWLPTGTVHWKRYYEAMQLGIPELYARLVAKNWDDDDMRRFDSAEDMLRRGFYWEESPQRYVFWNDAYNGDYTQPIDEEWLK